MTTTSTGHRAEIVAATYLETQGFMIIELNWKTRFCEIDIIACRRDELYFTEVKYRTSKQQGSGLEYITDAKLRQMRYAAEEWLHEHEWPGQVNLAALEVSGLGHQVSAFIASISID